MKSIAPVYRYYLADLKTGNFVMEVPFSSVSWSRKVSGSGSFSGTISADPLQDNYDLYDTTIPGKYGLYVVRDGTCLWGGIIWGREYDITSKVLKVDGLEMTSYLFHRTFWKTLTVSGGASIKTLIETIMENVLNDQKEVDDRFGYSASELHNRIIFYEQKNGYTVEVTTTENHNYSDNETVYIGGFKTSVENGGQDYYNGETNITVVASNKFSFTVSGEGDTGGVAIAVGVNASPYSTILSEQNTVQAAAGINLDIDVDDDLKVWLIPDQSSGDENVFNFRGSEGIYVGEILKKFAEQGVPCYFTSDPLRQQTTKRFDFYIQSDFDPFTRTFSNVFKAWLVQKDNNDPTSATEVAVNLSSLYGPSKVPASNYVFEHPGNIVNLSLSENSSTAATRTWVFDSSNSGRLGSAAARFYASYTNLSYLENGWPLLDRIETLPTGANSDQEVYSHAFEVGYKLAPPVGEYSITVNGSFDPEIGTYQPGDWCIVVPGDEFISARLKSPYENRENILVRKIASFDVSVPDNPTFPETVKLDLVAEWEVSKENLATVAGNEATSLLDLTIFGDISKPFPELYNYNGIDPVTPISFSVRLMRTEKLAQLQLAEALVVNRQAIKDSVSLENSTVYRAQRNVVERVQQELTARRAAFNAVLRKGYKKKDKRYKQAAEAVELATRVFAKAVQDLNAITLESTQEYIDAVNNLATATSTRDTLRTEIQVRSQPVTFQRFSPIAGWEDLPSATVLTNTDGVAVYNYIVDGINIPEANKEPQNRLTVTHENPFPQTLFRVIYSGQGQFASSQSSEVGLYIRSKYELTYVPRYNNALLVGNDFTKIATTPLTAAQVATTFSLPNLTDIVITSAVVSSDVATITTFTSHQFRVGDLVSLYNLTSGSGYVEYTVLSVPAETTTRLTTAEINSFTIAYEETDGALTLGTSPKARYTAYPAIGAAIGPRVTGVSIAVTGWQDERARLRAAVWADNGTLVAVSGNTDIAPKITGLQYIDMQSFPMNHTEDDALLDFNTKYLVGFKRNTANSFSAQWALDTTAYPLGFPQGVSDPNVFYDNRTATNDVENFNKDETFTNTSLIYVVKYEVFA
jgi:hypothetical protein